MIVIFDKHFVNYFYLFVCTKYRCICKDIRRLCLNRINIEKIINNFYCMRLSKLWFVSGEREINAEAETEFVLLRNILEKRSDLPFSRKGDRKKEKNMVSFMHEQNIICSQIIGCHWAWADHYLSAVTCRSRGGLSSKEKEETLATNGKNYYLSSGENYFLTRMPCFIYLSQTRECPFECEWLKHLSGWCLWYKLLCWWQPCCTYLPLVWEW